ncbi:MAG: dTMP kinase [Planctomycetia bacterium]|nr:dTMP kinase [Planctomycetia bacterium]
MFIAFEGCDGAGKGVQLARLHERLESLKIQHVMLRDPGDTCLGDAIRKILLEKSSLNPCVNAEAALFMAARAQLIHEKIIPALQNDNVVVIDRYLLSTAVYQGYANNLPEEELQTLWRSGLALASNLFPDLTLVLDCPTELARQRINRQKDRIESRKQEYHERVALGYRYFAQNWSRYAPGKVALIDAAKTPEDVWTQIQSAISQQLDLELEPRNRTTELT